MNSEVFLKFSEGFILLVLRQALAAEWKDRTVWDTSKKVVEVMIMKFQLMGKETKIWLVEEVREESRDLRVLWGQRAGMLGIMRECFLLGQGSGMGMRVGGDSEFKKHVKKKKKKRVRERPEWKLYECGNCLAGLCVEN